jgi:hypothetical protein
MAGMPCRLDTSAPAAAPSGGPLPEALAWIEGEIDALRAAGLERPARVRVAYLDRSGTRIEEEIEGLYAVCFQHELDHLNGVLFIDHLSRLRRDRAMSRVKKTMRLREDA